MKLFQYELGKKTCVWAQIEEVDIAKLLLRGGFARVACGNDPTPDFVSENCAIELKCIEDDPLFPNGSLRYIANPDEFVRSITTTESNSEIAFKLRIKTDVLLTRAERLIRRIKHQLRAHKAQGRVTGAIIVNNASFSISTARRSFAAALLRKARETGVIDFVISLNVFAQPVSEPVIDLFYLPCGNEEAANGEMLRVVELLKGLHNYIPAAGRTQKPKPHPAPHFTVKFRRREREALQHTSE